jgi:DNA-binding CsgD family transcriptional regulator
MNADNSSKITEIELKLKFENEQKIKEFKQQRTRFVYIFTALGLFGLIIVLVMLYGRLKINVRHSKSKAINLYIENKRLQEDIDFKNRELATNVMYLLKKNELINYISEKLLKAKVRFKSQNQSIIEEILLDLQSNINSEIWLEFEKRFQAVHKGFYDKLNMDFPKLTDADKKLCALLRLNLSTKEIASISHQNPNSVEVARTRLRKKLDLSNQDISLISFLSNL